MKYDPSDTFVTSDHHFGSWKHNPCPWRPPVFSQEEEEGLIAKWNSVVKPTDFVIHVGDFCDGGVSDLMAYRKRLNGSVLLVKGNHDILPDEVYKAVFQSVCEVLVIEELNVMFQHCPSAEEPSSFRRVVGHFHDGVMPDFLNDGRSFCSCVMLHGGYPVPLEKIIGALVA